jgi:hypothetical protein
LGAQDEKGYATFNKTVDDCVAMEFWSFMPNTDFPPLAVLEQYWLG